MSEIIYEWTVFHHWSDGSSTRFGFGTNEAAARKAFDGPQLKGRLGPYVEVQRELVRAELTPRTEHLATRTFPETEQEAQ
jgi:hypothetical protein